MVWSEDGTDGRRYSGGLGGSLRLDQEPPEEGDGERGSRISSGIGLGGIGEGSCQRCKILAFPCDKKKKRKRTRNSRLAALSVMTVISCAVDALCSALPGLAKETLPTSTLCTTVLSTCQTSGCFMGKTNIPGLWKKSAPGSSAARKRGYMRDIRHRIGRSP